MKQKEEGFGTQRFAREAQALTHEATALTREVVTAPFRLRTYRLIRKILIGFILVSIANVLFSYFFYTPKMYRILSDNREIVIRYRILQDRIRTAQRKVDEIRHRDNHVYRALFSTDTLSIPGVWQPYPDSKYAPLAGDDYAPLMIPAWKELDALARTIYLESVSFDELQRLSKSNCRRPCRPSGPSTARRSTATTSALSRRAVSTPCCTAWWPTRASTWDATAARRFTPRAMPWWSWPRRPATTEATASKCCSTTSSDTRPATPT